MNGEAPKGPATNCGGKFTPNIANAGQHRLSAAPDVGKEDIGQRREDAVDSEEVKQFIVTQ
jgi:hypothetical protein